MIPPHFKCLHARVTYKLLRLPLLYLQPLKLSILNVVCTVKEVDATCLFQVGQVKQNDL